MKKMLLSLVGVGLTGLSSSLIAGPIPYPNAGSYNNVTYNFTATGNGPITAYFYGSSAGYGNVIGLAVNGVYQGIQGLQDNSTPYGTSLVLGNANAGDTLTFLLFVDHNNSFGPPLGGPYDDILSSDPTANFDLLNHVYSTSFTTDGIIPSGTFIGFEDIDPATNPPSDLDYNDEEFVFTGVSGVPDGGMTVSMLGMALVGFNLLRRKA